ncbi:MAG: hypothetical protein PHI34_09125 [Acidobacteriota bacterium]|nr:hypothetical protein [Acidobacteriota bacterium]
METPKRLLIILAASAAVALSSAQAQQKTAVAPDISPLESNLFKFKAGPKMTEIYHLT